MSAQNSGRQSPPPEEQSDKQQQAPTADAKGVNTSTNNQQESKDQLAELTSNPEGPLDQHSKDVASKVEVNKGWGGGFFNRFVRWDIMMIFKGMDD